MAYLAHIFAAMGIFFASLFGGASAPVPTLYYHPAHTSSTSVAVPLSPETVPQVPTTPVGRLTVIAAPGCSDAIDPYNLYLKGESGIYFGDPNNQNVSKIEGADLATFKSLCNRWGEDKNAVYEDLEKTPFAPATFHPYGYSYASDGKHVHVHWSNAQDYILSDADPATFQVVLAQKYDYSSGSWFGAQDNWYAKDATHAFNGADEIRGADISTFVNLGFGYAKDKNHVYYANYAKAVQILDGADPTSFTVVTDGFGKDATHVYSEGVALALPLNPATFAATGDFIKDATAVYYNEYNYDYEGSWTPLAGADPTTFTYVGRCASVEKSYGSWYKDSHLLYTDTQPQAGIDPATFVYFGEYESVADDGMGSSASITKDKNHVYYGCNEGVVSGADAATFTEIGDGYFKDANGIWYIGDKVSGADSATFALVSCTGEDTCTIDAKDKNHSYFGGQLVQ